MSKKVFSKFFAVLSLVLILSSAFPAEIFAQTSEVVRQETVPLVVEINNTAYSSDKRLVSIDFSVQNNSATFVDNLKYSFEFYNGDKLEKDGLLFRNLDYVVSKSDTFPKLAPGESKKQTIQFELPPTIPGGSYFIRSIVYNDELSYYGITYTKEPLFLTGRGTFISSKSASLIDVENKKTYQLMEGPTLEKDKTYLVSFPEKTNKQLFEAIAREDIYSDIKISHISDKGNFLYEEKDILLKDLINEDTGALEFKMTPWDNMLSGAHTAFISFKNSKGEQISETVSVRLLYRGLLGRIYEAQTNINSYRKGERINLVVNTIVAGDPLAKTATLKAFLKSSGEVVQEIEKEIVLNGTFQGTDSDIDFSDIKIKSKTLIDEIELILSDENGNILDTQTVTMDPTKIFEYPKSNLFRNILFSVLFLVVAVFVLAIIKKKIKISNLSLVVALVLMGGTYLVSGSGLVFAQWDSNDGNSNDNIREILFGDFIDIWSVPDDMPSGYQGFCSDNDCSPVEFYVKVSCKACANIATNVIVNFYNYNFSPQATKTWNMQTLPAVGVNEWIFGPFIENFCFERETNAKIVNNEFLEQSYRLESKADFGGDYCQYNFDAPNDPRANLEFTGINRIDRSVSCALESEIRTSFYLDFNQSGIKDTDEPYIKSPEAPSYCSGIEGVSLGAVKGQSSESVFGGLVPQNCSSPDYVPYFFKEVDFGNYIAKLDPDNAFGWMQTGVEYFYNNIWSTQSNPENSYFPVGAGQTLNARVGIKNINPVTISCVYLTGAWEIENFYSDDYTQDELDYEWEGDVEPDSGVIYIGSGTSEPSPDPIKPDPKCTATPSVIIKNVATDIDACYPHEKKMCKGFNNDKSYQMIGVTLTLNDPCHTGEIWFINTNFNGSRVLTNSKKHGETWDVPINRTSRLSSDSDKDTITVDGWTTNTRINQGATRTVSSSRDVSLEMCDCEWCEDPEANNFEENEECQYTETTLYYRCPYDTLPYDDYRSNLPLLTINPLMSGCVFIGEI